MSTNSVDFQALHFRDALASPGYIFGALAILLTAYCISKVVYNLYFHPLSKFPGPKFHAATVIPQCWYWMRGNEHVAIKALHDKYGEVVRVTPGGLSFTSAQAWKDIYGYRVGSRQIPKDMMFYLRTGTSDVSDIIVSNDADHTRFRKSLSNAFSDKALRGSEPILNTYFDLLIKSLKERASSPSTSTVDLMAWYNWTTFDIIGDLAFGEPFHALENAAYHPYITGFFQGFRIARTFRVLRLWNLENPAYRMMKFLAGWNATLRASLSNMQRRYSEEIIEKRLSPERMMSERQDFMYHVLRQEGEKGMTRKELEKNASLLVIAGSETTATFLSGTTYNLLKNPEILESLTNEVRGAFKSADEITLASTIASEMPYLHATIEEGLRMYPPVPSRLPRRTTDGTTINGHFIPPNTAIGVHQYSSSHSAKYYHNPDQFYPPRWLSNPPPEYANDILDSNQPFSIGPRNCLGRNLAYGEMRCILARMVWEFDFEMDPRTEGWNNQKTYVLWEKGPLLVKLKRRQEVV